MAGAEGSSARRGDAKSVPVGEKSLDTRALRVPRHDTEPDPRGASGDQHRPHDERWAPRPRGPGAGRARRAHLEGVRPGRRAGRRPRRGVGRAWRAAGSPPSWARRVRASRRSCTAWPAWTRSTRGEVFVGDVEVTGLDDKRLTAAAPRPHRLRVPVVQPGADADRAGEHHAADRHRGPQARPGVARHGHRHDRAARAAQAPAERAVRRPAAAGRVRPRAGRPGPRSSSRTSRPATSTRAPARRCCRSCATPCARWARPSSWSPTTRSPRRTRTWCVFLADGRLVDQMADPTAEKVLERMKGFELPGAGDEVGTPVRGPA